MLKTHLFTGLLCCFTSSRHVHVMPFATVLYHPENTCPREPSLSKSAGKDNVFIFFIHHLFSSKIYNKAFNTIMTKG